MHLSVVFTMDIKPVPLRTCALDVHLDVRSGREGDGIGLAVHKRAALLGLELTAHAEVALKPGYKLVRVPEESEGAASGPAVLARTG